MPDEVAPLPTLTVGEGRPLLLLHGFAMHPRTYLPLASLLAPRCHVVIPAIFQAPGLWNFDRELDALTATLDHMGLYRVSLLGHSFGGGLELGFAARHPDRVVECVFGDTLGVRDRFQLADEALRHPVGVLAMATWPAASAFVETMTTHPLRMATAGLWAFATNRKPDIDRIAAEGIPCHVLWANRDSLLRRADGRDFARDLNATFTVAEDPVVDHDWMFDDPELFAEHLYKLKLQVFEPPA